VFGSLSLQSCIIFSEVKALWCVWCGSWLHCSAGLHIHLFFFACALALIAPLHNIPFNITEPVLIGTAINLASFYLTLAYKRSDVSIWNIISAAVFPEDSGRLSCADPSVYFFSTKPLARYISYSATLVNRKIRGSTNWSNSSELGLENSETMAPSSPDWNQCQVFGGIVYWSPGCSSIS